MPVYNGKDESFGFVLIIVGAPDGVIRVGAVDWLRLIVSGTNPELCGPVEAATENLCHVSSTVITVPAVKSKFMLIGIDGSLIIPPTPTTQSILDKVDGMVFLGYEDPDLVAQYQAKNPSLVHILATEWTTLAAARDTFKTIARTVMERAVSR